MFRGITIVEPSVGLKAIPPPSKIASRQVRCGLPELVPKRNTLNPGSGSRAALSSTATGKLEKLTVAWPLKPAVFVAVTVNE